MPAPIVRCPTCQKQHPYDAQSVHRPFCSSTCKHQDLSAWAQESYRLPADLDDDELDADWIEK